MRSGEVAKLFSVHPKTVTRWAREGKLPHSRTIGGHSRFLRSEIEALHQRTDGPS